MRRSLSELPELPSLDENGMSNNGENNNNVSNKMFIYIFDSVHLAIV
jgi:hypothetical protein